MIEDTESDSRSSADLEALSLDSPNTLAKSRKFPRLDRTTKEFSDIPVITTSEGMPRPMPLRPDLREAAQQEAFSTSRQNSPSPINASASLPQFAPATSSLPNTSRTTLFEPSAGVERTGEQALNPSQMFARAFAQAGKKKGRSGRAALAAARRAEERRAAAEYERRMAEERATAEYERQMNTNGGWLKSERPPNTNGG